IVKAAMKPLGHAEEYRTALFRVATDGDYVVELFAIKFLHMLRTVPTDINPKLAHCGNRFRANSAWSRAGTFDVKPVTSIVAQKSFSHLTAGGMAELW